MSALRKANKHITISNRKRLVTVGILRMGAARGQSRFGRAPGRADSKRAIALVESLQRNRPVLASLLALAPHEGHTAALYLSGAEAAGVLWYLLYLRPRIAARSAGVLRQEAAEPEAPAEASPSVS